MINGGEYIFSLGAHVALMQNVPGICNVMSIWSWEYADLVLVLMDVYQMVMDICWAYIRCMCLAYVITVQLE